MIRVPRLIARMLFHNAQKQMDFILKVLLRYPFTYGNPGYQGEAWASLDGFHTHWYRCPAYEYVRDHGRDGEVEFFYKTWCQFDYAAAQVMVEDGRFERPHCLSLGDEVCDMRWYANNQAVNRQA
jgi:hypothetical protein